MFDSIVKKLKKLTALKGATVDQGVDLSGDGNEYQRRETGAEASQRQCPHHAPTVLDGRGRRQHLRTARFRRGILTG